MKKRICFILLLCMALCLGGCVYPAITDAPGALSSYSGTADTEEAGNDTADIEVAGNDTADIETAGNDSAGTGTAGNDTQDAEASLENTPLTADTPEDLPSLKDCVASADGLGEDAVFGTCLSSAGIHDDLLMGLIEKHFNAVTLENELKPDAMFGYNNDMPPAGSIHEEELNGKIVSIPALDHSRADAILDVIAKWNTDNPESPIRVRGHVLVWHSQTPEWFFHEDYDKNNDYVSKEEMDLRLEWYIKSMLEYYTGENSRYKGLFYGWDVVNEAVSDKGGSYRTDTEAGNDSLSDSTHSSKSSWWKVYGSNEYIINAFKYANLYAPEDLDLYYNDYNECDAFKKNGIIDLIGSVKAADGARIDGFGMQGHYLVNNPPKDRISKAAADYASVVDKIMITELDVKSSVFFNGTEEALSEEFERQKDYYSEIYDVMKELKSEGLNISGIVFWGAVDTYSWLHEQGENPLLFDKDYKAKPAFYAFTGGK
ncbi:MAG: endo-1,4-beta-xylanase [Lachnospiraceae bacterium]|nr:endo-1,4-beta-xylanase [Lachnospiraceae bacterium]